MEYQFKKEQKATQVTYGEMLNLSFKSEDLVVQQVIVLVNQRYYDRFFEKITRAFAPIEVNWYICTNQLFCNNLSEFMDVMDFLSKFSRERNYLIVGFGNEGIMSLTGFVQKTTVLSADYWLLPVSVRSFTKGLSERVEIVKKPNLKLLEECNLPERIIFDQTISEQQKEGKLVDFIVFLRCGLLKDHEFLRMLFRNYPSKKQLMHRSFSAMTSQLLGFYQTSSEEIEAYGTVFTQGFYAIEQGHLLSDEMKRFLGLLFHFIWNVVSGKLDFQLENFFIWLDYLGLPVVLDEAISISDYLNQVFILQKHEKKMLFLTEIGRMGVSRYATEEELVEVLQAYQKIAVRIRGR